MALQLGRIPHDPILRGTVPKVGLELLPAVQDFLRQPPYPKIIYLEGAGLDIGTCGMGSGLVVVTDIVKYRYF